MTADAPPSPALAEPNDPRPGTRILVFGGNRGIGRAIVERFAALGCTVAYASRNPAEALDSAYFVPVDLADPEDAIRTVAGAARMLGGMDVVVFGSATFLRGEITRVSLPAVRQSLDINLVSLYTALRGAIPHLREAPGGGRFVAISSITGPVTGLPGMAHYGMAKAGMEGLIRTAALELAADGITVNAVEPGLVRTESLEHNYGADRLRLMDALIPGGRMAHPRDVAAAVSWLASPASRHINGAVVVVDGGLTLVENPYAPRPSRTA